MGEIVSKPINSVVRPIAPNLFQGFNSTWDLESKIKNSVKTRSQITAASGVSWIRVVSEACILC